MKKEIVLAGGCFWGVEKYFASLQGVEHTEVGYANGKTENPTYEEVCRQGTDHAEAVRIAYDDAILPLWFLLEKYADIIDPVSVDKQGNDVGRQYRTGIYYTDEQDLGEIQRFIEALQKGYTKKIAIEVEPLQHFYEAEEYHQKYLDKNPGGYCHIGADKFVAAEKARAPLYRKPSDAELRQRLTPLQYEVTQQAATERPFDNEYWDNNKKGIYVDVTTGEPLFSTANQYDAGCGWPSFTQPIAKTILQEKRDATHGMIRTEVRSKVGDAHLGHVFDDGPKAEGGLRYCINSAALRFVPQEDMEKEGYAEYLPYI